MKFMSCNGCGVVLDEDKLQFADDIRDNEGCVDQSKAQWNNDKRDWVAFTSCPVCKSPLFKESP